LDIGIIRRLIKEGKTRPSQNRRKLINVVTTYIYLHFSKGEYLIKKNNHGNSGRVTVSDATSKPI